VGTSVGGGPPCILIEVGDPGGDISTLTSPKRESPRTGAMGLKALTLVGIGMPTPFAFIDVEDLEGGSSL